MTPMTDGKKSLCQIGLRKKTRSREATVNGEISIQIESYFTDHWSCLNRNFVNDWRLLLTASCCLRSLFLQCDADWSIMMCILPHDF